MSDIKIYHNPRCSKSRQTLKLLEEHGVEPQVVESLRDPPDEETLRGVVRRLGIEAQQLLRTKESLYREVCPEGAPSPEEAVRLMVEHPVLTDRPIVDTGSSAAIGRPPENILPLLPHEQD